MMKLFIKNMVCDRCILVVRERLEKLGYTVGEVKLGEALIEENPDKVASSIIDADLKTQGFEVIETKQNQTREKIKNLIIERIYKEDANHDGDENYSNYLAKSIGRDYSYLSQLFSSLEHITIEKFIILQKIERVKELLDYDELSLSEISYRLNYSSVQHLSSQFKKVTGLTPSQYKQSRMRRTGIDKIPGESLRN